MTFAGGGTATLGVSTGGGNDTIVLRGGTISGNVDGGAG